MKKRAILIALLLIPILQNKEILLANTFQTNLEAAIEWELKNNELILQTLKDKRVDEIPVPYWLYTTLTETDLKIDSNGYADCSFYIEGVYKKVEKISSYMYLQKKEGDFYYTIANGTWNKLTYSFTNELEVNKKLNSKGSYRVMAIHYVYTMDGQREEVTVYSYIDNY